MRFTTSLEGAQEVTLVVTDASGRFEAELNHAEDALSYELSWDGLEGIPSAAHIHLGAPGANGGPIVFLADESGVDRAGNAVPVISGASGSVEGIVTADHVLRVVHAVLNAQLQSVRTYQGIDRREFGKLVSALRAGQCYVNIHTDTFTAGQLRGQIK